MSESWFEGVGLAESPFAEAESAMTDDVEALAWAWPAEAVGLPPSWPEDEEDNAGGAGLGSAPGDRGESEDEAATQTRAFLGGSIWTYASRACGSPVSVFVPAAAQRREKVDLMLYVHGYLLGPCDKPPVVPEGLVAAAPFALGKIVAESARPMILVVPRFQPGNNKSWSPHRLDHPSAINALIAEVLAETGRRLNRAPPTIDQLIVAGHSRAYGILYPLAHASASPELGKGALARLSRIWALDATYGTPPIAAFESLTKTKQGLRVEIIYRMGAKSLTDKFECASRAGALALRPIPQSIAHCDVPARMLPALLAELPPPRPDALDAGSEAEDLWAETPGSGWSQSGLTETEWLEAEPDALDRFDTLDSRAWDESHAFGEKLLDADGAELLADPGFVSEFEELHEPAGAFEAEDLFEAEEFARHALYEAIIDEDADHGEDVGDHELEVVPARSRPPIRRTAQLRTAWRDYECARHKMRTLRLFGWDTPVNPNTVDAWRALEQALLTAGYQAHRAWVFKCRDIGGQQTRSLHAYGLAIDIDHARPICNVNRATPDGRAVIFSTAATKDERCRDVRQGRADTSFTPAQVAAVEALRTVDGHQVFAWGGRWRTTKDTMHFQINVTPAELARGIRLEPESGAAESDLFEDEMDAVESFVPPMAMPPFTREHYQMSDREKVVVRARHGGREVRRRVTDIVAEVLRLAGRDPVAWYNDFTSGVTFLGRPIRDPIHVHLAEHLHDAEHRLAARYGGANADPTAAGVALGLDKKDKIIGSRPYPTSAPVSMHMFGLAIDVNYTANPFISEKANPVFARAGQLIRHRPAAWRKGMTYAQLSDLNQTLKCYFALLGDDAALQASLTDATTEPWHGKTVAQAQSRIQKDLQGLARLWQRTDRDQLAVLRKTGFMNLKQEFVKGIGLSWGAAYGDMMHFDMRNDGGIGHGIYEAIRRWMAQQAKAAAPPAP
jgi:hypothetical protein